MGMPTDNTNPDTNAIRVVIADDHSLAREGIKASLSGDPGILVVAEARTGREAVEAAETLQPQIILMDVKMPEMDGFQAAEFIRDKAGTTKVLIVSGFEDKDHVRRALEVGVAGFINKDASPEFLRLTIRVVSQGALVFSSDTFQGLFASPKVLAPRVSEAERAHVETLTAHERDILRAIATGQSNQEIGFQQGYSEGTIKNVIGRVFDKLGVNDRAHAVYIATRAGVI